VLDALSGGGAGRHRVHGHVERAELRRERARQADEPELRCAVGRPLRERPLAADRRDVDDPPAPALLHLRHDRTATEERAGEIDAHHFLPVGLGDVLDVRGRSRDAGVVDEYVDRAEAPPRGLDHRLDVARASDVGRDGEGAPAARADLPLDRADRLAVSRGDDDARTRVGERDRDRTSDALAASGDDRNPCFERFHRVHLLVAAASSSRIVPLRRSMIATDSTMSKLTLNTYVEPEQKESLARIARRRRVSQATIVREAIAEYVSRHDATDMPAAADAWRRLLGGYYSGSGRRNDPDDIYP
jgi:hypothetical protein